MLTEFHNQLELFFDYNFNEVRDRPFLRAGRALVEGVSTCLRPTRQLVNAPTHNGQHGEIAEDQSLPDPFNSILTQTLASNES